MGASEEALLGVSRHHTVSGPALGQAVQSLQTNSNDVLLPEECRATPVDVT